MIIETFIDEKIIRVTDILLQIQKLNEMIDFHTKNSRDDGMKTQYQYMRETFIHELDTLLNNFQISVLSKQKAA